MLMVFSRHRLVDGRPALLAALLCGSHPAGPWLERRFSLLPLNCTHFPPLTAPPAISAPVRAALPASPTPFPPLGRSQAVWVQGSQGEPLPTESFPNSSCQAVPLSWPFTPMALLQTLGKIYHVCLSEGAQAREQRNRPLGKIQNERERHLF